jgi:AraC-like DNA-binding protein
MSSRTLQRALAREGTAYHSIADQVRRAVAEQLLAKRQPVCEIANVLGFNDVAAFHRAFRRWTGSTPGVFRSRVLVSNHKSCGF